MPTYIAGWNQTGYLPEVPAEEFSTFADAREYLVDTVDRWLDEDWEEADADGVTADDVISDLGYGWYKDYVLWVEELSA